MMTREKFLKIVNKIDTDSDYPWKHELNYLRDHDAEQRAELTSWRETAKDIGAVDPHALALHLDEQCEAIKQLRQVLEFISVNDHSLTAKQMSQCAAQALDETEPRDERAGDELGS